MIYRNGSTPKFLNTKSFYLNRQVDLLDKFLQGSYLEMWVQELSINNSLRIQKELTLKNGWKALTEGFTCTKCGKLSYACEHSK